METLPGRGYWFLAPVEGPRADDGPPDKITDRRGQGTDETLRARYAKLVTFGLAIVVVIVVALGFQLFGPGEADPPAAEKLVPLTSYPGRELHPDFSPDGQRIAFIWGRDGNFDVFTKVVGTGDPLRLTSDPADDLNPRFSPDGRFVAFARNLTDQRVGVFVVPSTGGRGSLVTELPRRISPQPMMRSLAWTPDGGSLIIGDRRHANPSMNGLLQVSLATGETRRLTTSGPEVTNDQYPSVSPRGDALAFVRFTGVSTSDIFLLQIDDEWNPIGSPRRLTRENGIIVYTPHWTAGGEQLVYRRFKTVPYMDLMKIAVSGGEEDHRLHTLEMTSGLPVTSALSPDGSRLAYVQGRGEMNIRRILLTESGWSKDPEPLISSSRAEAYPRYSPDGRKIAFASDRSGAWEIWVSDRDGKGLTQLTSMDGPYNAAPAWSPDGKWIAFGSDLKQVYVVNARGGVPRLLADQSAKPSWSRNGEWIYFGSRRSGEYQIWKKPFRGGEEIKVTVAGGYFARESFDGRWLYYSKRTTDLGSLWKMPLAGGEETVVTDLYRNNFAVAEGSVYFMPHPEPGPTFTVKYLESSTGRITSVAQIRQRVDSHLDLSPDGRELAYTQFDNLSSDIVMIENFQ